MCSIMGYCGGGADYEAFCEGFSRTKSRGPDDSHIIDTGMGLMGFHRLAIMGLTPEGMQPFSLDGSYVVCNGEIYGYERIKKELSQKYTFVSGSDCEVLLPMYREYGVDMFRMLGALPDIRFSGTDASGWYIPEAKEAMENGSILYAGKYSEPDYERIVSEGCGLAIENTMILHSPEVKEKLESLGIPVMVERSSYEEHPLGRLEWIRLYGLLYGKEQEADAFYEEQLKKIEPIMEKEDTGRTVAFFYITANGAVNVRKPNDYIAQMIGLAGGTYVLNDRLSAEENALSTMNMQMEDFYAAAKDADILIYNSTIEGELYSVDELLAKSTLFSDFKAVKEGNVYCTGSNFFQESTGTCDFIEDLHKVLADETDENYRFLKHVR